MKTTLVLLMGIVLLGACKKGTTGRMCTEEYRFFNVKLQSAIGEPIVLDTFYTRIVADHTAFHARNTVPDAGNGYYAVLSDGQLQLLPEGKEMELRFIGVRSEKIIVNEPYIFKNNGCHIEKISGKNEVTVP
ncbi:hypothetical protein [Niabella drilacis]|uniref:Uncharacterized protein n=1 Tax=Niabella drilacis (strain DSM 25811 / CCM 8410 / CCUG 62505 / LMG 26954 / E90) TaxID=1285928 RepID=A0A1G6NI90_NIADE|nr:hypothetical protein [Niabella drilacis]SDC67583.1 hypothetical protein SAMN04487894_103285 [Niabella drilacis]